MALWKEVNITDRFQLTEAWKSVIFQTLSWTMYGEKFIIWPISHLDGLDKGLRLVLEGFVITMYEGKCETESQIPRPCALWQPICGSCTKPECIVTTNPDRSVLITIITWHFQFHLVNVSILCLKYEYGAWGESRFACYSHCYVIWCPLMTGIVASQCTSASDAVLMTCFLTPLTSACLKPLKRILPQ